MSADTESTPIVKLSEIGSSRISKRIEELRQIFTNTYEHEPQNYYKIPGRVNLIGEHVDYCGYPVFPMALEQSFLVAVCATDDGLLKLSNVDPTYEAYSCNINDVK